MYHLALLIFGIHRKGKIVAVLYSAYGRRFVRIFAGRLHFFFEEFFEGGKIVFLGVYIVERIYHIVNRRLFVNGVVRMINVAPAYIHKGLHQLGKINRRALNGKRI